MRPSPARGFTLVEVLFTLALVALITTTGAYTYRAVFSKGNDRAGTVSVAGLQAAARGVAARNGYTYPLDLASQISSDPGVRNPLVDGSQPADLDSGKVSLGVYQQKDPSSPGQYTTAVFALATSSKGDKVRCVFLLDNLDARTTWARDDEMDPENCRADQLARTEATNDAPETFTTPSQQALRPLEPSRAVQVTGTASSPSIVDFG